MQAAEATQLTACPSCGSGRLACLVGSDEAIDLCCDCLKAWERLPPGEPHTRDGEMMPFGVPCNNCAFRGKSLERLDAGRWAELQFSLANGGLFFCHKGVPFDPAAPSDDRGFEFPRKTREVDLGGVCYPYKVYDQERMRLCRGFLNQYVGGPRHVR